MWPNLCTEKGALKLREKRISNVTLLHKWVTYWVHVWNLLHLRSWASYLHQCVYVHSCMHVRVIESTVNTLSCITSFGKVYAKSLKQTKCCYSYDECAQLIFPRRRKITRLIFTTRCFIFGFPYRKGRRTSFSTFNLCCSNLIVYSVWMIIAVLLTIYFVAQECFD